METSTRNIKQVYRRFTDDEKKQMVRKILNRPTGMTLDNACNTLGIRNPSYYTWKKQFGMDNNEVVSDNLPMYNNNNWTQQDKINLINRVENLPENVRKTDVYRKYGISKQTYYGWRNTLTKHIPTLTQRQTPMTQKNEPTQVTKKKYHSITLRVSVGSTLELVKMCGELEQMKNVDNIFSID